MTDQAKDVVDMHLCPDFAWNNSKFHGPFYDDISLYLPFIEFNMI